MAKASGPMKISGRIGDLVFYIKNGQQYVMLAGDKSDKRRKSYKKNEKFISTNKLRGGVNYFAASLYRLMKQSGVATGSKQFNAFKNEIQNRMKRLIKPGDTIKAADVKQRIHGYQWRNNHEGQAIHAELQGDCIVIENTSSERSFFNTAIKYQINVYRRTLDDVHWNGEKYDYQLPGKIPAFAQLEWICTPEATSVRISLEGLAENEFIVMSILPMQDEHYVMQSGASVWVF